MAALITGTLASASAYAAEENVAEFSLDPMVVTAQRTETRDLETPATVTVVTAKEIEAMGANTVNDVLEKQIGVTSYSYSNDGDDFGSSQSRMYLRGFDKGALVMINGAPINIFNYASLSGVPLAAVEKIEIVKGANSVLYGAEALGGVVNIITKKGEGDKMRTTLSGTVGNYLKKWSGTIQGDGYLVSIGKDYKDKFDPAQMPRKSADSQRVVNKYKRDTAFASFQVNPNLSINWGCQQSDPMYWTKKISTGTRTGSAYRYEDTKHQASMIYADANNGTKTTLAYNSKKVHSDTISAGGSISNSASSNYTAGNLYVDSQKEWKVGSNDSLITGITVKRETYDQTYADAADNSRNSYGLYLSYNKKFNEKFNAILGMRGQYYNASDFESSHKAFTPQLQTLLKIKDNLSWYTNIAKGFEVASINAHTGAGGTSPELLNQNKVKPESGWNYETGLKKITDSSSTKLAIFKMDYKDKFAWKEMPWLPAGQKVQVNIGEFENTGVELEYKKQLGSKWNYGLGAIFQNPKSNDTGKWVQESAKRQYNVNVDYVLNKFSAGVNAMIVTNREDSKYKYNGASGTDHQLRDRFKLNANLTYRPEKNQSVALNLYNLLDRTEPVAPYEYYDLPFNWTVTYNFTF